MGHTHLALNNCLGKNSSDNVVKHYLKSDAVNFQNKQASASACVKAYKFNSVKAMTSEVIDLDQSRLRLCIEILPETSEAFFYVGMIQILLKRLA